ncbi:MAG TPA: FG-GAP-like repeat-containing protein, partial [Myxococcota bacterium]|nr:FG-GAP-like repeat-containing protein [Myxococcota bacterium]
MRVGTAIIPEGFPEGEVVIEVHAQDAFTDDIHECLDTNGDGDGHNDENGYEKPCVDINHKFDIGGGKVKKFEEHKSPELVSRENPGRLGETVEFQVEFTGEMDPTYLPILGIISGIHKSMVLDLLGAHWEDGVDDEGQPLPNSVLIGTWNIPDDLDVGGQDYLRLEFDVAGVYTKSGKQLKTFTEDREGSPLLGWYDLVRPKPTVPSWIDPNVECGTLEINFAIQDEPSFYEPGAPIEPPSAKFGSMVLHLEKDGAEILTAPLTDPNEHFVKYPPWGSGDYRWWVEVEDTAGNLDQISFEQQGMYRTAVEHFSVSSCVEQSTFCRRLSCKADERSCEEHIVTCESSTCLSCHCDNDLKRCVCAGGCDPNPGGDDNDGSDTYPPGYDRPDESHLYADDVPRWEDVTNEYQAARVGVLRSSVYPSMFGLLDEFGEKARLVQLPLSSEDLEGVDLLIVPSGGLRNQQTEEFREGVLAYVEGGGQLLVMAQPLGENFDVLPGEIEGYGWQQDRSCISRNIWIEEEYREHPALSAFGSSVIDIPLDGHFTVYPEGSQTLLRKVSNNRVALFSYAVGEGSVTVTSSYMDYWRALSWGRSAAGAVELGYGRSKTSGVMFFRDLISWLKMPAEIPRVIRDGGPVSLGLAVTNDAPGGEHAALAKLLVQEPNRNVITETVDLPVDLAEGESTQLSLDQEYDSNVHALRYGIWHVAVELYDGDGNLIREARDNPGGRFAVPYPIEGESYVPEDIVITITTDKSVYLSYETAHISYTVENQGDRERHLELYVGLVHVGSEITQDVILAPGEKWIEQRDYGLADYREDGVFCMALDLDDNMRLAANAGLKIFFLDYPLVLSASTERQRIATGESIPVSVLYRSLYDSTIRGTLFLRAEGRPVPLMEQELAVAPAGVGSLDAILTIPADAEPGQLTLMGRYEDEEGHVLGSCSHRVAIYSPFIELSASLEPDREIYRRGDAILSSLSFTNDSDKALDIHYQLRLGDIESSPESMSIAAGGGETRQVWLEVPWDYPYTANEDLALVYWETPGRELYKKKRVMIEVPHLSSMIGGISATPASVDVSCEIFLEGRSDLQVDAGCRLYDPAGGLVAEELHPAIMLEPFQHLPLGCHLPPGFLEQGDYTIEVFAESPLARRTERVEKIKSDIEVKPPVTNIIGPALAWEKSFGEAAGPVMLINRGDFSYPSVFVTESLPEVGMAWSREVSIGPRQELLVEAPAGVTIPYFRNAASHYRCIGREIMTETEDDLAAEIAGGFTVARVETARISTPRLGVAIENVDLDLCLADTLSFDVKGHSTVKGLGGPEEMIVKVSVPGAGFEQDVSRTISPSSTSWSEHFDVTLPTGIENASDEIRAEIVKPDVKSYPIFMETSWAVAHFTIVPAMLSARLSAAPGTAGGSGSVTIESGGMLGTDYGWNFSLTGFGGVEYLSDAGGGHIDGCGAQVSVPFTLPSDLANGRYRLHFALRKGSEDAVPYTFPLDISGLAAGLELWTDRDVYRLSDPVYGLGTLTNGPVPVTGGDLHLEVVRLRAGADVPPWPALGAGVSRRFASAGAGEIEAPRLLWEQAPASMAGHWADDRGPALADLDGDGAADVVLVSGDGVIRAYRGRDGALLWDRSFTPSGYSTVPQVADIDGDSSVEVFVQLPASVLCLSGETGQILWEAPLGEQHQVGAASPLGVADLDGDGVAEVFHLDFESGAAFLHVRDARDGTSLWDTRGSGLPFAVFGDQSLAAGDLDGNGAAEVLVTGGFAGGLAAIGDGGSVVWAGLPECSSPALPVPADLDGDGTAEVITTCSSNFGAYPPEVVALSGSDGGILWRTSITAGGGASTMPMSPLTVADLNGDGLLEIAGYFGSPFGGDIVVLDDGGNETWRLDYGSVSGGMPACDLDGDGRMELLVLDEASVPWSLRLLDGATGAQVWDAGESGLELWGRANPAVADLDGDGWLEIALVDSADWSGASGRFVAIDSDVTGGPRPGGEIVEEILWQTDRAQDLGASESVSLSEDIGLLGVTGQLWFRGWLTSALGQELARDRYPFLIVDGDQALSLMTDAEVYKTGDTVSVSGLVSELSGLPASDLVVTVRGAGGAVLYQEAFDLAAYEQHAYAFTLTAGVPGNYDLSAELTLAGGSVASALARYRVAPVQIAVSFGAPDIVDVEPFDLVARIENNGELAADLDLTLSEPGSQEERSVSLQPGEISEQVFTRSILEDTAYHLETVGDLAWSDDRLVRFGPASMIAVTPFGGYSADEPVDIPWALANTGLFAREYEMSLDILDASGQALDSTSGSYLLALPGDANDLDKAYGLWSPVLPPGDYSLRYSAEFGNSGITPITVGLPVATAGVSPEPSYRTGLVEVPWSVTNISPFDADFALDLSIMRGGQPVSGWSLQVYLDSAGGIADRLDDVMAAFLEPGAYQARVGGAHISEPAVAGFTVLPDRDVRFTAAPGVAACGLQPFDLTVANAGWEDFTGFVTAESDFWQGQVNVAAAGRVGTWAATLQADLAAAEPGMRPFTLKLHDSAGEVLSEIERTVAVQGGVCALASVPPQASFAAGGEASFPFVVSNGGDQTAHCRLTLDAFEEQGPEQANLTIEPCAEAPVSFGYLLPWDLEGGPQTLGYSLEPLDPTVQGSERGFTTFQVDGVELQLTATLDKCFYRPQDTAQLDLLIENIGSITDVPLIASLSYPGSEVEVPFELSDQPQTLHFEIPLGDIPADRILYSISFNSGRSIYIDTKRVYGGGGPAWLCSDKDVYDAGDTVELTFGSDEDCDFKIRLLEFGLEHEEFVTG